MPKVLVISAHRLDRSPSQRFRYEQYLDYLKNNGFEFTFSPLLNESDDKIFYSKGNYFFKALILFKNFWLRKRDLRRSSDFDIVFIQREAMFLGSGFFERGILKSGAKMVFDFDDSIWLADTSPENKKFEWLKDPNKTINNIGYAHLVIAGNNFLAEFARKYNDNVIVIPTTVNTSVFIPKPELRNKDKVVIGWSGSISTVKHFNIILPALKKLKEKYGNKITFKVVGDASYSNSELGITGQAWNSQTETDDLNSFDIGIMPLPDDEWSKGKCGLKGLTYMACEVPAVMSNVGMNKEIIHQGENGVLCNTENDWVNNLSQLIEDQQLRESIGKKGRETVVELYSIDANKEKYLNALNSVLK